MTLGEDIKLQVHCRNLVPSLLGAMVFPRDPAKAEIYAAHFMATALGRAPPDTVMPAFMTLSPADYRYLFAKSSAYAPIHKEAQSEAFRGMQVGAMTSYLWHERELRPPATWEDAVWGVEKIAGRDHSGVRSTLLKARAHFLPVLHYWSILSSEYSNRIPDDFQLFVARASVLLREMREWEAQVCGRGDAFRSGKIIVPLSAASEWPSGLISISVGALPGYLKRSKLRAGRPRKKPVLK